MKTSRLFIFALRNLRTVLLRFLPNYFLQKFFIKRLLATNEFELAIITSFCDQSKDVVDIGSSGGIYSFRLAPFSSTVHSFEPVGFKIYEAKKLSRRWINNIQFYEVALTNYNGEEDFEINILDSGISKFRRLQGGQKVYSRTQKVITRTLDSYGLRNISIIKIDVEGSEIEVLQGALETIEINKPVLLIESENRHRVNSLSEICRILEPLNYEGYFFVNCTKTPIEQFNENIHQKESNAPIFENGWRRSEMYINNFLFTQKMH